MRRQGGRQPLRGLGACLWLWLHLLLPGTLLAQAQDPPPPEVAAESLAEDPEALNARAVDATLERALGARLRLFPELRNVRLEATARVLTLEGEVPAADDRALAETLARAEPEALEVRNRISVATGLAERLQPTARRSLDRLERLVAALPLLLLALLAVVVASWIGRRLARTEALFGWIGRNHFLRDLARQAVKLVAVLLGLLIGLDLLGATAMVGAVLGTAGVVGLAVGFAFKDLIENYIASVLLSLRQPFAPNDHVLIDGEEGRVVALTPRATLLLGFDGALRMLPNAMVFKSVITNFSRNPQRRLEFDLGVRPGGPLTRTHAVLLEAVQATAGVLADPAPAVSTQAHGDQRITLLVHAWVDQRSHSLGKVRSEAIRQCVCALAQAGIALPQSTLRLLGPARPEDARPEDARAVADHGPPADTRSDRDLERQVRQQQDQQGGEDLLKPATAALPED